MAAQQFQQLMPTMKVASDLFAIRGDWDLEAKKKMMTGPAPRHSRNSGLRRRAASGTAPETALQ